jgi:menaquinone-dependent protoporphyrinogen IX oxidase
MNVLVVYEDRDGITTRTAQAIAEASRAEGADATVRSIQQVSAAEVQGADLLFVGASLEGSRLSGGKLPAGVVAWVDALPPLAGKPAALFCTYPSKPKEAMAQLRSKLEGKGASMRAGRPFPRKDATTGADELVKRALAR